jgi:hypothetical protein
MLSKIHKKKCNNQQNPILIGFNKVILQNIYSTAKIDH